jgi:hypothetical protein
LSETDNNAQRIFMLGNPRIVLTSLRQAVEGSDPATDFQKFTKSGANGACKSSASPVTACIRQ